MSRNWYYYHACCPRGMAGRDGITNGYIHEAKFKGDITSTATCPRHAAFWDDMIIVIVRRSYEWRE